MALRVLIAAQALEKAAQRAFRPHALTPAQFNVLNLLVGKPEGLRASDLAEALVVDRSNVTGLLQRMKKDQLVQALGDRGDRRQHVVGLTPKGRAVWSAAWADYSRCLAILDAPISRAHEGVTEKVLQQLVMMAASLP